MGRVSAAITNPLHSACSSETLAKEACVTKPSCWSQTEQWRIMKLCLKSTTGQIERFVWEKTDRAKKGAIQPQWEEDDPRCWAEWAELSIQTPACIPLLISCSQPRLFIIGPVWESLVCYQSIWWAVEWPRQPLSVPPKPACFESEIDQAHPKPSRFICLPHPS